MNCMTLNMQPIARVAEIIPLTLQSNLREMVNDNPKEWKEDLILTMTAYSAFWA